MLSYFSSQVLVVIGKQGLIVVSPAGVFTQNWNNLGWLGRGLNVLLQPEVGAIER